MSSESRENYYQLLGLDRHASVDQIKEAYRDIAKLYHPDSNFYDEIIDEPLSPDALERFKAITAAYTTLVNDEKRAAYDHTLPPELKDWDSDDDDEGPLLRPRASSPPTDDDEADEEDEEEEDDDEDEFRPTRSDPTTMFDARGIVRDRKFDPSAFDADVVEKRKRSGAAAVEEALLSWYTAVGIGVLIGSVLGAFTLRFLGYI